MSLRSRVRVGLILLASVVLFALVSAVVLLRYASSTLPTVTLPALAERPATAAAGTQDAGRNVLLVAVDAAVVAATSATDMVLLVQAHPDRDRPVVVAFPTRLKVDVPGRGGHRLDEVHGLGGPDLLVKVVEDYTGIQLDHYAEISIPGVMALVDRLGGTVVCLEEPVVDGDVRLTPGCDVVTGAQSAAFLRSRQTSDEFGATDVFGRVARQQHLLAGLLRQTTGTGTLLNPFRLRSVIDGVAGALLVDDTVGARQLLFLGRTLGDMSPESIDLRVVPSWFSAQTGYVHAYPEATAELLQALREGEALPDEVGLAAPENLTAADVRVMVLNGEGSAGLANEVADHLTDGGFVVVGTDNHDTFGIERSLILTTAPDEPRARLLAELVPGAEVRVVERLGFDNVHLVLVVGSDRAGVAPAATQEPTEVDG